MILYLVTFKYHLTWFTNISLGYFYITTIELKLSNISNNKQLALGQTCRQIFNFLGATEIVPLAERLLSAFITTLIEG